jgi:hypothetical protein
LRVTDIARRAAEVEQWQPFTDWVERPSDPQPEPDPAAFTICSSLLDLP